MSNLKHSIVSKTSKNKYANKWLLPVTTATNYIFFQSFS